MTTNFYYINLPGAAERRDHCEEQFAAQEISCRRFAGLDARKIGMKHPLLNTGHTGCYLSHYMLVQQIRADEIAVILEDDVVLHTDFSERVHASISQLPADWEVAFIGWGYFEGTALAPLLYDVMNDHWIKIKTSCLWGTHAYMVNGTPGADALLSSWEPIRTTVDSQITEDILSGKIKAYFLHPDRRIAWQGDFVSQIAGS